MQRVILKHYQNNLMAEHLNQRRKKEMSPFNQMGKPILMRARSVGYEHCKAMGLSPARAVECVNAVAEQLSRDQPYEAQAAAMKFLDLIGAYRLFAVILCEAQEENKISPQNTKTTKTKTQHANDN